MPVIDDGKGGAPMVGPGGRVILGWVPRRFDCADQSLSFDGDREMLRRQMSRLIEEAEARVSDPFLIIERSPQYFMQCLCEGNGWLLEKREGEEERHFRALAPAKGDQGPLGNALMQRILAPRRQQGWYLTQDQIGEVMSSYLLDEPEPDWLEWERFEV